MSSPANLLIVACSQAKNNFTGCLPAIERYDGPVFRLLRKYRNSVPSSKIPRIEVLSAKFGLISANDPIPLYDQKMTEERAEELRPIVINRLQAIVDEQTPEEIFVSLSHVYEQALDGFSVSLPLATVVTASRGTPGKKLSELYTWLYGKPAEDNHSKINTASKAVLRGVEIKLTSLEIINIGRKQLANHPIGSDRFQTWYVTIDGTPVSTKWLVSQITGLPVSKFGGTEARRLLQQLGVKVENT